MYAAIREMHEKLTLNIYTVFLIQYSKVDGS